MIFSYVSKAALKIGRKLEEDEEEAMGAVLDIGLVGKDQFDGKTRRGPGWRATASSANICSQSDDGVIVEEGLDIKPWRPRHNGKHTQWHIFH